MKQNETQQEQDVDSANKRFILPQRTERHLSYIRIDKKAISLFSY